MKDPRRALTLTIDANSAENMQMLLTQALYEINQLLPLPPEASPEQKNQASKRITQVWASGDRVTAGHSQGSIGSYDFSFVHSSREFKALEDQLLEQGYKLKKTRETFLGEDYYVHPSLPPKVITGDPLAIEEKSMNVISRI